MNTFSHILIGGFLHKYFLELHGIDLNYSSFIGGNLLPDFKPAYKRLPHELNSWEPFLKNEINKLSGCKQDKTRLSKNVSRRLGVICHFYADFFCYPHTEAFDGGTYQHVKYEWELDRFTRKYYPALYWTDFGSRIPLNRRAENLYNEFSKLHKEYIMQDQAFENDIVYTLRACIDTLSMIFAHSAVKEPEFSGLLVKAAIG